MNEILLKSIKKTNLSIEEISGVTGIREVSLYHIIRDEEEPGPAARYSLAIALDIPEKELFPDYDES